MLNIENEIHNLKVLFNGLIFSGLIFEQDVVVADLFCIKLVFLY